MVLMKALSEKGLDYEKIVIERNIPEDTEAIEEMSKIPILTTPTIKIGDKYLIREEATKISIVRRLLEEELQPVLIN